jgi:aryl-alcohol dehydrogenase-like predicted oxidoreductase
MERRPLGRTGIDVPVIGMGTWRTFDVRTDPDVEQRRRVVDAALESGTSLFDTSPMYGRAERVLARALEGRRPGTLVADKVWAASARDGREQVRRALGWYGGMVDIYQIHNLAAWREQLPMLDDLRAGGQVRVVGATHYLPSAFRELMAVMTDRRVQMVQIPYNAAERDVEREVLPLAEQLGLGVLVMQPLATGSLVRYRPTPRELAPLAAFGVRTWGQALLKWIVSDRRVHAVLPATRRAAHAVENAGAGDPPWLDAEMRDYVARLAARS